MSDKTHPKKLGDFVLLHMLRNDHLSADWIARRPGQRGWFLVQALHHRAYGEETMARLGRRLQGALSLRHPHIAPLDAFSQTETEAHLAFPYQEHATLRDLLPDTGGLPQPQEAALEWTRQIARALGQARRSQMTPHLQSMEDAVITAAGRALLMTHRVFSAPLSTAVMGRGIIRASFGWMSPEAVRGLPETESGEVFFLGLMLYRLLTGKHPFYRKSEVEKLTALLHDTPAPPSDLLPGLDPALETLIAQCLDKQPARRLPHPDAVADKLDALLGPTMASRITALTPAQALDQARAWLYEGNLDRLDDLLYARPDLADDPILGAYLWDHLRAPFLEAVSQGQAPPWKHQILAARLHQARWALDALLQDRLRSLESKAAAAWLLGDLSARGAPQAQRDAFLDPLRAAKPLAALPEVELIPIGTVELQACDADWSKMEPVAPLDGREARRCGHCGHVVVLTRSPHDAALVAPTHCLRYDPKLASQKP